MPEQFFDWTTLPFPAEVFALHRRRMARQLATQAGGVYLAPSQRRFSDGTTFRQLDDFLYFTGLELPDSILAIDGNSERTIVFAPEQDSRFTNPSRPNDFPGRPLARDPTIRQRSGIDEMRPLVQLGDCLKQLEAAYKRSGAQRLPFASIVKSGPNALWPWRILAAHYNRRNRTMQSGELVIFDVGCELDYYREPHPNWRRW